MAEVKRFTKVNRGDATVALTLYTVRTVMRKHGVVVQHIVQPTHLACGSACWVMPEVVACRKVLCDTVVDRSWTGTDWTGTKG